MCTFSNHPSNQIKVCLDIFLREHLCSSSSNRYMLLGHGSSAEQSAKRSELSIRSELMYLNGFPMMIIGCCQLSSLKMVMKKKPRLRRRHCSEKEKKRRWQGLRRHYWLSSTDVVLWFQTNQALGTVEARRSSRRPKAIIGYFLGTKKEKRAPCLSF